MTNSDIYNHFRLAGIPSATVAQAADAISAHVEDMFSNSDKSYRLHNGWMLELLNDFVNLYGVNAETALVELEKRLI